MYFKVIIDKLLTIHNTLEYTVEIYEIKDGSQGQVYFIS
jgi:hypothetical protein